MPIDLILDQMEIKDNGVYTPIIAAGTPGADGVSPEVTIAQISGGHSVTITDADHPQGQQFDVMDGQTGPGIPAGGSVGQVLKKQSATDYDSAWGTDNTVIISDTQPSASDNKLWVDTDSSNGDNYLIPTMADMNAANAAQDVNIGIVQNGSTATQNIAKGKYVIWNGALYIASAAIASGATLSGSNLTAVTDGGVNSLRNTISNLIGYIDVDLSGIAVTNADSGWYYASKNIAGALPPYSLAFAVVEGTSFDANVFYSITTNDAIRIKSASSKTLGNRSVRVFYYLYGGF